MNLRRIQNWFFEFMSISVQQFKGILGKMQVFHHLPETVQRNVSADFITAVAREDENLTGLIVDPKVDRIHRP